MNIFRNPIMVLGVALLVFSLGIIPMTVTASTPPLLPEMSISIPKEICQNSGFPVEIEWDSNNVTMLSPPPEIYVNIYKIPEGTELIKTKIPRDDNKIPASGRIWYYKGEVTCSGLAAGEVMVIATDPISGAECRMKAEVKESDAVSSHVGNMDAIYTIVAVVLIVLLIGLVGYLIKIES